MLLEVIVIVWEAIPQLLALLPVSHKPVLMATPNSVLRLPCHKFPERPWPWPSQNGKIDDWVSKDCITFERTLRLRWPEVKGVVGVWGWFWIGNDEGKLLRLIFCETMTLFSQIVNCATLRWNDALNKLRCQYGLILDLWWGFNVLWNHDLCWNLSQDGPRRSPWFS